ncbi:MAG: hypothetical protein JXB20_03610 [Bacilli bacterium]|nr:hypothetical protein [Bacilli bacterium]MBN2697161.1 hypothetical protein [Bacilli bacterium]
MKKILLFCVLIGMFANLSACVNNRVFVENEIEELAMEDFGFTESYCFKNIDTETAKALTGTEYRNAGVLLGIQGSSTKMLFVPRSLNDEVFVVDFPFLFEFESIIEELSKLEDSANNSLYSVPADDYGGLTISVAYFDELSAANPDLEFDSEIIFRFTTQTSEFLVASVESSCLIFSSDYQVMNQ